MASTTTASQCPTCGAPLEFSPETGRLDCPYCESSFTPQEVEAFYAAKNEQAAEALAAQQAAPQDPELGATVPPRETCHAEKAAYDKNRWDASTIAADWGEDGDDVVTYTCTSCGGEVICSETAGAAVCPYCGNPTIVPGQFSLGLKPDGLIPFKYTQEQAIAALKRHYRGHFFLPSAFTAGNHVKKLQGSYVPYWLFSGSADARCTFDATISRSYRDGDYLVTETDHYDVRREGRVPFEKVPCDASSKMPDALMDSLEPYDYDGLVPFSSAYLPGFAADKYDVGLPEASEKADGRCAATAVGVLRADATGYQSLRVESQSVAIERGEVTYALLPVWTILTEWDGKTYLFAMNGQTGKFTGDLPVDKGKVRGLTMALTVVVAAVLWFLGVGSFVMDVIWAMVA